MPKHLTPRQIREIGQSYRSLVENRVRSNSLLAELLDNPGFDLDDPRDIERLKRVAGMRRATNERMEEVERNLWENVPGGREMVERGRSVLRGKN